ncbi:MAG: TetR/AcrR family transcriptional regulator [Cyanobacteria bacterium J06628_6]
MPTKKISRRGRPRGFDVDAAIATAAQLFHQRGYDGVGVAELSKTIGITAPSLYAAFGSKRDLFEQALQYYGATEGGWLAAALASSEQLEDAIATLFTQAAAVYSAKPDCPGCLVLDGTRNCGDQEARALTLTRREMTRQVICDRIATHPKLTADQAETLADYAMTILVGLSSSARDGVAVEALQTTAQIAAGGFAEQLSHYID